MTNKSLLSYILLFLVIVIWAVAWPASKIGLMDMPPIWYTALRLCIGFITVFLLLLVQKKITLPKKRDLPLILTIGLLQMACFLILINGGLLFVDAGRSAILVYSTPFLVTPIAVLFFQEKITYIKLGGLILGLLGLLMLFTPWNFDWHNTNTVIGNSLLLLAALCWAIAMLHTRYGTWHSPSLNLVPWQLLIACIFVIVTAFIMQPHPQISWTTRLWVTGIYNGVLATGFAYAAIIYVSKELPVVKTSLLLLGVPVLGLLISAAWLGEKITSNTLIAMLFIMAGLVAIVLERPKKLVHDVIE
jgi:drug/metabolite transporter (DMT)-like permease